MEKQFIETLNTDNIIKEGCFITGGRGSGKSYLGFIIADKIINECKGQVKVKVFDSSLAWKRYSGIPRVFKIEPNQLLPRASEWNCIIDCSRLSPYELRELVNFYCALDFQEAVELTDAGITDFKGVYILEEAQNLVPSGMLRRFTYQDTARFIMQGRNYNLSYIGITQRLSACDTNLVEISGVKYWFKTEGQNNLRKAKAWLPKQRLWQLRDLKTRECFFQYGSSIKRVMTPYYKAMKQPEQYIIKEKPSMLNRLANKLLGRSHSSTPNSSNIQLNARAK